MSFMDFFSSGQQGEQQTAPWIEQQGPLTRGFKRANKLYKGGGPEFFEGDLTVGRNPLINQSEEALMGYAGGDQLQDILDTGHGATADMLGGGYFGYEDLFNDPNVGGAYQQALSGDPNPYTAEAASAVRQDMMEDYSDPGGQASQIRNAQVSSGQHGGSSRGDIMNMVAQDRLDENMRNVTANMYQGAHENAQSRMLQGLGVADSARRGIGAEEINRYGSGIGNLAGLYDMQSNALGVPGMVGTNRMAYDQQLRDDDIARWDFNQARPENALDRYMGRIQGNYGSQGSTSQKSSPSPWQTSQDLFNKGTGIISTGMGLFG